MEWINEKTTVGEINGQKVGYPGWISRLEGENAQVVARPELGLFGLSMTGSGEVAGATHVYDFPWVELGKATVVDVGGDVGGFSIQLAAIYPELSFIIQDTEQFLRQGREKVWHARAPDALEKGRVTFMPHDFFTKNPVKGAAVYWLRNILHDWSDSYCVRILQALKPALGKNSRILLCEQIVSTTLRSPSSASTNKASSPLPINFGSAKRSSHARDLALMTMLNGIERTPEQFEGTVQKAGLRVERFWDVRSQVGFYEVRLL